MEYIKHNVNRYLLFMILLSSTSLAGVTVLFQHQFTSMVADYEEQIDQVNGLSVELQNKQRALTDAEKALVLRQAREEKLHEINERLASEVHEQSQSVEQPTGAVVADAHKFKAQPQVIASTVVGEGFSARPRRGGYALIA